jgi:hypothetical protein
MMALIIYEYDKFIDTLYKVDTIDLVVYDTTLYVNITPTSFTATSSSTRDLMNDYVDNINDNKWDIQSYPTILVFDQNKYLIYKGSFYSNKNILINNLDAIVNRHISNQ